MKISYPVFKNLTTTIKNKVEADEIQDDTFGSVVTYILDDLILTFNGDAKKNFIGLSFEAMGQSFHIIPTGEILLEGEDDDDTMVVEDEAFMKLLEEFLEWRTKVVETMGV